MDRETWRFINSFAPWLSAIGTLATVIVALYLAHRGTRVKLCVKTEIIYIPMDGLPVERGAEFLQICVTNIGHRETNIAGILWRTGFFKKKQYVQFPPDNILSTKLPAKLGYSDRASFFFEIKGQQQWKKNNPLVKAVQNARWPKLNMRWVRAGVYTTTGEKFLGPIDRNAWGKFIKGETK